MSEVGLVPDYRSASASLPGRCRCFGSACALSRVSGWTRRQRLTRAFHSLFWSNLLTAGGCPEHCRSDVLWSTRTFSREGDPLGEVRAILSGGSIMFRVGRLHPKISFDCGICLIGPKCGCAESATLCGRRSSAYIIMVKRFRRVPTRLFPPAPLSLCPFCEGMPKQHG